MVLHWCRRNSRFPSNRFISKSHLIMPLNRSFFVPKYLEAWKQILLQQYLRALDICRRYACVASHFLDHATRLSCFVLFIQAEFTYFVLIPPQFPISQIRRTALGEMYAPNAQPKRLFACSQLRLRHTAVPGVPCRLVQNSKGWSPRNWV